MKTITKTFGNNDVEISFLNARPSGYGHYKINGEARIEGTSHTLAISLTTTSMKSIDALKSEDDEVVESTQLGFAEDLFYECQDQIAEWKLQLESSEKE